MRKNQQRKNKLLKKEDDLLNEFIEISKKERYDKAFNEVNDVYEKTLFKLNSVQTKMNELQEKIETVENRKKDEVISSSAMATYELNKKELEELKKSFANYENDHKKAYEKLEEFKKTGKVEEKKVETKTDNNFHKETLKKANDMWAFVKKYVDQNPEFKDLNTYHFSNSFKFLKDLIYYGEINKKEKEVLEE